jgi:hypothetical protein
MSVDHQLEEALNQYIATAGLQSGQPGYKLYDGIITLYIYVIIIRSKSRHFTFTEPTASPLCHDFVEYGPVTPQ